MNNIPHDPRVVTYQLAYLTSQTVSLCAMCKADPDVIASVGALGPVSHGAHQGICDGCRQPETGDPNESAAW